MLPNDTDAARLDEPSHRAGTNPPGGPNVLVEGGAARSLRPRRRGPKSPAGRARVGTNAITHGLSSLRAIIPGESPTDWEDYRRTILEELAPVGPVELALAERVAS